MAVNALRAAHNDLPLSWSQILQADPAPAPGHNVVIYAAHIRSLRNQFASALWNLCPAGVSCAFPTAPSFSDPNLTSSPPVPIRAVHFTELQNVTK